MTSTRSLARTVLRTAFRRAPVARPVSLTRLLSSSFSTAAPAPIQKATDPMLCFQCEQTDKGTGCTTVGICGKTPEVAGLQDLLVHTLKGISQYTTRARALGGAGDKQMDRFILQAFFSTLTNVNFDAARFEEYIKEARTMRDQAKKLYEQACAAKGVKPERLAVAEFSFGLDQKAMLEAAKQVGVEGRRQKYGADKAGLQELIIYGLKGTCAYFEHASKIGAADEKVQMAIQAALDATTDESKSLEDLLKVALDVGATNLRVMELLEGSHKSKFGVPSPHKVDCNPVLGKCILVSGHDLQDLEALLKQTEGKGINIYTHGEMLPAHSYPELRKYKHLVGHFGGPWQLQKMEFGQFPGAILMTSNCLVEPRKSYKSRIFTTNEVGWPGVKHVKEHNYADVIKAALDAEGFTAERVKAESRPDNFLTVGFGKDTVLSVADKVVAGVKSGAIKRFFVVGGCDGSEGERSYFTDVAKQAPKDSIILTLGCGKYRINRLPLGDIGGIPRLLDMGQCNDSYGAIQVAVALAKAFNTDVNSLPLSFAVSWFEQKAVAVLLTLLHLNIQNIRLGPALPAFATPNILSILVKNYKIKPIGKSAETDMAQMVKGQ